MVSQFQKATRALRITRERPVDAYPVDPHTEDVHAFVPSTTVPVPTEYILDHAVLVDGTMPMVADLQIRNQKQVRFYEPSSQGAYYVGLKAPDSLLSSISFYLPETQGNDADILMIGPSGDLYWSSEISDARGEMSSLDERLDVAIDEYGNLKGEFTVSMQRDGATIVSNPTAIDFETHFNLSENPVGTAQITFKDSAVDHVNIQSIGTNSHDDIDDHIEATTNIHGIGDITNIVYASGSLTQLTTRNHHDLQGLLDDDHTQYALLATTRGVQSIKSDINFHNSGARSPYVNLFESASIPQGLRTWVSSAPGILGVTSGCVELFSGYNIADYPQNTYWGIEMGCNSGAVTRQMIIGYGDIGMYNNSFPYLSLSYNTNTSAKLLTLNVPTTASSNVTIDNGSTLYFDKFTNTKTPFKVTRTAITDAVYFALTSQSYDYGGAGIVDSWRFSSVGQNSSAYIEFPGGHTSYDAYRTFQLHAGNYHFKMTTIDGDFLTCGGSNNINFGLSVKDITTTGQSIKFTPTVSFAVDTNVLYVDPSTNRVGINTTPSYPLHVVGASYLNGTVDSTGIVKYTPVDGSWVEMTSGSDLVDPWYDGAAGILKVGIKFNHDGNASANGAIFESELPGNGRRLCMTSANDMMFRANTANAGDSFRFYFKVYNTDVFHIDSTGVSTQNSTTITSAGLLTASAGLTITTGALTFGPTGNSYIYFQNVAYPSYPHYYITTHTDGMSYLNHYMYTMCLGAIRFSALDNSMEISMGSGTGENGTMYRSLHLRTTVGGGYKQDYLVCNPYVDGNSSEKVVVYRPFEVTNSQTSLFGGLVTTTNGISSGSDVEITNNTKGVILKAPNGLRYRLTIDNAGVLTTTLLA